MSWGLLPFDEARDAQGLAWRQQEVLATYRKAQGQQAQDGAHPRCVISEIRQASA